MIYCVSILTIANGMDDADDDEDDAEDEDGDQVSPRKKRKWLPLSYVV